MSEINFSALEHLLKAYKGNTDAVCAVLYDFMSLCPKLVANVEEAVQLLNPGMLASSAHNLKVFCSDYKLIGMIKAADKLERMARAGVVDDAPQAFEELVFHYEIAKDHFNHWIALEDNAADMNETVMFLDDSMEFEQTESVWY